MKWEDRGRSRNLEDRRGSRGPGRAIGGGAIPLGIGGVILVLVISALTGVDLSAILGTGTGPTTSAPPPSQQSLDAEEEQVRFVSFVLDDVQAFWSETFRVSGVQYPEAQLVLYRDAVQSGCGVAPAAAGPFYCPADQKVYLDLSFYDALRTRFGAPGDFAQAYVIAHELGHHVQNVLGVLAESQRIQQTQPGRASQASVATELMADCYAGVWAAYANSAGIMERGDLEEGLGAAAAVGDDTLAQRSGRIPNQETFTHGSSAQRQQWFSTGFETGDPNACDTFTVGF